MRKPFDITYKREGFLVIDGFNIKTKGKDFDYVRRNDNWLLKSKEEPIVKEYLRELRNRRILSKQ